MVLLKNIENHIDDDALLTNYKQSYNQQPLATLFLRYSDLLYGVCFKYLKSEAASKDAVMHIYTIIVEKLKHHEVEFFKGWIYTLTKNYCLMELRKDKKIIVLDLEPQIMQSEDFSHLDDILSKEKAFQKLENCIETLNEQQSKVIQLFYLQDKCYNEIAVTLNLDWNKIRSLVQNGRRNLKICMEENE